jgi:hypothetical protein
VSESGYLRYLAGDERLVLQVRRHITVLLGPLVAALLALAAAGFVGLVASPGEGTDVVDTVAGLVAGFFAARLVWRIWEWWIDRVVVTSRRVVEVSGILTRNVASIPLGKVTDMTYRRSIWGRLLGYGDLVLESAGQQQALAHIHHLPRPDFFYRTVTSLITTAPIVVEVDDGEDRLEIDSPEEDDTGPLPRVIV